MANNFNVQSPEPDGGMKEVSLRLARAGGFSFSASAVFMLVVGLIISLIITGCEIEKNSDLYIYLNYLAAPIAMTAGIILTLKLNKISPKSVFPVKCSPKYYFIAVILIFGLLFSVSYIDTPFLELFKLMGYKERGAEAYFPTLTGGWVVLALLVMAVMPAVFEEALFRGVLLNTCEKSVGSINTIFIVGLCFSLFHASPEQTIYQFIAGCTFAFIAIRSGSILPSVLMHFLNNGLLVVLGACNLYDEAGSLVMPDGAFIAVTVLSAVCFIAGIALLVFDKKPLVKGDKKAIAQFFLFAAAGIGILALSWILSFVPLPEGSEALAGLI